MKKLPTLAVIKKKQTARPVPKKALESFISTIFSTPAPASPEPEGTLTKERSHTTLKKQVRHGKALFLSRTEQGTPRGETKEGDSPRTHERSVKATSVFASKTKRTNPVNEAALGPGVYNPHDFETLGQTKDSVFKKKIDFGNQEGRKFTLFRELASPFKDTTQIENPDSWKYQHPEKESVFNAKKKAGSQLQSSKEKLSPLSLSTVTRALNKNQEGPPGPGSYDINFREELKVLD